MKKTRIFKNYKRGSVLSMLLESEYDILQKRKIVEQEEAALEDKKIKDKTCDK